MHKSTFTRCQELTRSISYSDELLPRLLPFQVSKLFFVSESDCFNPAISVSACRNAEEVLPRVASLEVDRAFNSATWFFKPSTMILLSFSCC